MSRFSQSHGAIGPVFSPAPVYFTRTANPYVRTNWQPRPLGQQGTLSPPQATSATIAGLRVGCCGNCANDHRNGG